MARTKRNNPELALEIGKLIRKQRKAAGITQAMLAEAVGLESETISRIENGIRLPSIEKLVEIADVLHVPVAVFFDYPGTPRQRQDIRLAERISIALENLPEAGKHFVLNVAQNYANYHVNKSKTVRKKNS